jgi:hypothetical protein
MPTVLHQLVWDYMAPVFCQDPNIGDYPTYSDAMPMPEFYLKLTEDIAHFIARDESLQARLIRHHGSKAVSEEDIFKKFTPCFNSTSILGSDFLNWKTHMVSLLDRLPEFPLMPLAGMLFYIHDHFTIDLEYQPLAIAFSLDDFEIPGFVETVLDDIVDCYLEEEEDVTPDASFDDAEPASTDKDDLELISIELPETQSDVAEIEAFEKETVENNATQVKQVEVVEEAPVVAKKMRKEREKYVAPPTDRVLRSMTRKAAQASMESPNLRKSPRNKVKTTNKK